MKCWIEQQYVKEQIKMQTKLNFMNVEDYQQIIKETAVFPRDIGLTYCTLGLTGEAGEVAEKVKKLFRDRKGIITPDFRKDVKKELGDVMWYVTALANELGMTLSEIMEANYEKLMARRRTNTLHGSGDNREEV